jgi:hypothetical protein
MAPRTIDRLTPEGKRFLKELKELQNLRVKIGYQRGKKHKAKGNEDEVDLVDIAAWNDLGTSRAPSRPFLRKSVDDNMDKIQKFGLRAKRDLLTGASAKHVLLRIGLHQKALVQKKIDEGPWIPNAPSTIRAKLRKGRWNKLNRRRAKQGLPALTPKPLIDEGTMRKEVMVVVEKR